MAITEKKTGEVSHVGQVVKVYSFVDRVMSDVYADAWVAVVIDGEGYRGIHLGCSEFGMSKVAEVDATVEQVAAYEQFKEVEAADKKAKEHAAYLAREAATVKVGKLVRVARGKKVPVGTAGVAICVKEGQWGMFVGIRTSDEKQANGLWKDVVFTSLSNVEVL